MECPHCGHFIASSARCAHCGMRLEKRVGLKWNRFVVFSVVAVGLFLGYLNYSIRKPELVRIGTLSPWKNFSTIRIQGVLTSDAQKLRNGTIIYAVDDGTGTIFVFANTPAEASLPKAGSRVSAVGSLGIGAGKGIRLRMRKGEHVIVIAEPVAEEFVSGFNLADITADQAGTRRTVYGRVSTMWNPRADSRAPYKVVLADSSGTLDVVHWLKRVPDITVGDAIEVTGTIEVYRGRVQLKLGDRDDIHPYVRSPIAP